MRVPHPAHTAKIPQGVRVQRRLLMQENVVDKEASALGTAEMMFYMLLMVYILLMVYMLWNRLWYERKLTRGWRWMRRRQESAMSLNATAIDFACRRVRRGTRARACPEPVMCG